jgi:hypothetical protein
LTFQALAPKLTEAQTQQAQALVLERIGESTDPFELLALAQECQALAPKLTDVQAEQALAALLRLIDQTSLETVAPAIEALAPRLARAQAEQALAVMLWKIGATTNSYTLQALAQMILAFVPKVSVAQAQQAFTAATTEAMVAKEAAARPGEGELVAYDIGGGDIIILTRHRPDRNQGSEQSAYQSAKTGNLRPYSWDLSDIPHRRRQSPLRINRTSLLFHDERRSAAKQSCHGWVIGEPNRLGAFPLAPCYRNRR